MFDYEDVAGQAFIKDNRLTSYELTATGIKLMISDINKNMDLGTYEGEAAIKQDYDKAIIEVSNIIGKLFVSIDLRFVRMQCICFALAVILNNTTPFILSFS